MTGLKGSINDKQSLKIIPGKIKHGDTDPAELQNLDQRTLNYAKMRSTESSSSATPISSSVQNYGAKGRAIAQGGSSSVGSRKLMKKGVQMSITDSAGAKRTPGKSYIYRMNSSFSKDGSSNSTTMPQTENNLPTISQSGTKYKFSIFISLFYIGKSNNESNDQSDKSKQISKEAISKMASFKNDASSNSQKIKSQNELARLKQSGALKYLPKLSIEVPMSAQRHKFVDAYNEADSRWVYKMISREDYIRKDQVRSLDSSKATKIVYDNIDRSPYYTDNNYPYIDDK